MIPGSNMLFASSFKVRIHLICTELYYRLSGLDISFKNLYILNLQSTISNHNSKKALETYSNWAMNEYVVCSLYWWPLFYTWWLLWFLSFLLFSYHNVIVFFCPHWNAQSSSMYICTYTNGMNRTNVYFRMRTHHPVCSNKCLFLGFDRSVQVYDPICLLVRKRDWK